MVFDFEWEFISMGSNGYANIHSQKFNLAILWFKQKKIRRENFILFSLQAPSPTKRVFHSKSCIFIIVDLCFIFFFQSVLLPV